MEQTINIYCDESCHLPNDGQKAMVLGGLWCFKTKSQEHNDWILDLKKRHNLSRYYEIKWSKVSEGKLSFYMELLDYFFTVPAIGFRAWIIPDKSILKHEEFNQKHDDWYYKMYFYLLRNLIWQDRINPYTQYFARRKKVQSVLLASREWGIYPCLAGCPKFSVSTHGEKTPLKGYILSSAEIFVIQV